MELELKVEAEDAVFDRVLEALRERSQITYAKINHGFWERLVLMDRSGLSCYEDNPEKARKIDAFNRPEGKATFGLVETGFLGELLTLLQDAPTDDPSLIFCASLSAYPHRDRHKGGGVQDPVECQAKIDTYAPVSAFSGDGLEFKRSILNGRFTELAEVLKADRFLIVSNADMMAFPAFIGAQTFDLMEIDGASARYDRETILIDIQAWADASADNRRVVVQCGGSLSAWLALRLRASRPKVTFIDLGLAMRSATRRPCTAVLLRNCFLHNFWRPWRRFTPDGLTKQSDGVANTRGRSAWMQP